MTSGAEDEFEQWVRGDTASSDCALHAVPNLREARTLPKVPLEASAGCAGPSDLGGGSSRWSDGAVETPYPIPPPVAGVENGLLLKRREANAQLMSLMSEVEVEVSLGVEVKWPTLAALTLDDNAQELVILLRVLAAAKRMDEPYICGGGDTAAAGLCALGCRQRVARDRCWSTCRPTFLSSAWHAWVSSSAARP